MPLQINAPLTDRTGVAHASGIFASLTLTLDGLRGYLSVRYYRNQGAYDSGLQPINVDGYLPSYIETTFTPTQYANTNLIPAAHNLLVPMLEAVAEIGVGNVSLINYTGA